MSETAQRQRVMVTFYCRDCYQSASVHCDSPTSIMEAHGGRKYAYLSQVPVPSGWSSYGDYCPDCDERRTAISTQVAKERHAERLRQLESMSVIELLDKFLASPAHDYSSRDAVKTARSKLV